MIGCEDLEATVNQGYQSIVDILCDMIQDQLIQGKGSNNDEEN